MTVKLKDGYYIINAQLKLRDAIKRLYQLSYRGSAKLTQEELAPVESLLYERKGEKRYTTTIEFKEDNTIKSTRVKTIDKKNPKVKTRSIQSSGKILDPFGAVFLARSLKWKENASHEFEVYDGKDKFLLKLDCERFDTLEKPEGNRDIWVISVSVKEMDKPNEKLERTGIVIYLSADKAKDILRVGGDTPIGEVRIELEKFEPQPISSF